MIWRSAYARICIAALLVCGPRLARAQAHRAEVIVTGDEVRADVIEVLRRAFERDGIAFERATQAPECAGTLREPAPSARVWVSWAAAAQSGRHVGELSLCLQDHCRSALRTLGPFSVLDARAREELITVVESGLSAMTESCSAPSDASVEPASASSVSAVRAAESAAHSSSSLQPRAEQGLGEAKQPVSEPVSESPASAELPGDVTLPSDTGPPHTTAGGEESNKRSRHFALGASYGLAHWGDGVVAQQLAAMVAYAVHAQPLYVGLELGFVPSFRVDGKSAGTREELAVALAIDASCVRVALPLWARWSLSEGVALDMQLGPALEWLRLGPSAATTALTSGARATSHVDPLLFARVGPSFRVLSRMRIGLDVQLDSALVQRSFGFVRSDAAISVFSPDRFRLSLALNAKAEL